MVGKGTSFGVKDQNHVCRIALTKLQRYDRVNTYLYKECCDHLCCFYIYACR